MATRSSYKASPPETPAGALPRFIAIRLAQIAKSDLPDDLTWSAQCGQLSSLTPTLNGSALRTLQLTNPMVVVRRASFTGSDERYTLVAGRRTHAYHLEQLSGTAEVMVLLFKNTKDLGDPDIHDALVQRLLFAPDNNGLELIAAQLQKDRKLRDRVSAYFPIKTVNDIASLLGMSRPTLHRTLKRSEALCKEISEDGATGRAGISILNEAGEGSPE